MVIVKRKPAIEWWNGSMTPKQIANSFSARVAKDGGIVEARPCLESRITSLKTKGFWDRASAVWLPHGYKEGKLYAVKGGAAADFGFTRAGTRRRKGPTYVEQVPYNLLSHSEDISSWLKTAATVTANQIAGPDGVVNADLIAADGTANQHYANQILVPPGGTCVITVYAKANTANYIHILFGGDNIYAQFSLSDGSLVNSSSGTGTLVSATAENAGNGWFKFSVIATRPAGTVTGDLRLYPLSAANNTAGPSETSTASMYAVKAQLIKGSSALDYFHTTDRFNVPALDYTNDSSCPALSLEPARTNLLLHSEDLTNAAWAKTGCSITANDTAGPDNLLTIDKVTDTATGMFVKQVVAVSASTTYTFSTYIKKGNKTWVYISLHDGVPNGKRQWFNLDTGAVGSSALIGAGLTTGTPTIREEANAFWRIEWSVTTAANTTLNCIVHPAADGDGVLTNALSDYGYFGGSQCEQGSYATSYIPTSTGTVQRIADAVIQLTGVSNLIGQTQGTLYFQGSTFADGTDKRITLSDFTNGQRVILQFATTNVLSAVFLDNSVNQGSISNAGFTTGTNYKICITWKANKLALTINGVKIGEDLSVTTGTITMTRVAFHAGDGTSPFYGECEALIPLKTAISDAEAIALTTP
jgi:hypothetical protein